MPLLICHAGFLLHGRKPNNAETAYAGDYLNYELVP